MDPLRIGVVGAGNISGIYLTNLGKFPSTRVTAIADLDLDRARSVAAKHEGIRAMSTEDLIASPDVDLVLNLTIPAAHAEIAARAVAAGKHVYNEKPLATEFDAGRRLMADASAAGLLVGCAPDTFLGAGNQRAREIIERGDIGVPVLAHGFMMYTGPEKWHPSPEFFYKRWAGPLLDMGPYYITAFVNLFGPIKSVTSAARITYPQREIGSEPLKGTMIEVETPTSIVASIEFHSGVIAGLTTSFDTAGGLPNIYVFGDEGRLEVPDPNTFGGPLRHRRGNEEREIAPERPFAANSRGLGVADLAHAAAEGRAPRASGALALHVLEAMLGILDAAQDGGRRELTTRPAQPEPIARGEFAAEAAISVE